MLKHNNEFGVLVSVTVILIVIFQCINMEASNAGGMYAKLESGVAIPATKVQTDDDGTRKTGYIAPDKLQRSVVYGMALGYQFTDKIALDLEFLKFGNLSSPIPKNPVSDIFILKTKATPVEKKLREVEYLATINKFHVKQKLFMVNVRYTFSSIKLSPYITAGLGLARTRTTDYIVTSQDDPSLYYKYKGATKRNLAYNIGGGLSLSLRPNFKLDFQYRLIGLGDFQHRGASYHYQGKQLFAVKEQVARSRLRTHLLSVGIHYIFGNTTSQGLRVKSKVSKTPYYKGRKN